MPALTTANEIQGRMVKSFSSHGVDTVLLDERSVHVETCRIRGVRGMNFNRFKKGYNDKKLAETQAQQHK